MDTDYGEHLKIFRALCSKQRLAIMDMLCYGERCANVLLAKLGIGQRALDVHIKILKNAGLVNVRKEGKWKYYSISESGRRSAAKLLSNVTRIRPKTDYLSSC